MYENWLGDGEVAVTMVVVGVVVVVVVVCCEMLLEANGGEENGVAFRPFLDSSGRVNWGFAYIWTLIKQPTYILTSRFQPTVLPTRYFDCHRRNVVLQTVPDSKPQRRLSQRDKFINDHFPNGSLDRAE